MKTIFAIAAAGALLAGPAVAGPSTLWAVEASATGSGVSNQAYAEQFGLDGSLLQRVTLGSGFNPTGIAIIGTTGYVSSDSDGMLRTFDLTTGAIGTTIATGQIALGALASDGRSLFATDFAGGNQVYQFSIAGALLSTFPLSQCGSYCNGLEVEGSALLANAGQNVGPYSRYSTSGTLLSASVFSLGDDGALAYNMDAGLNYAAVSGGQGGVAVSNGSFIAFGGTIADSGFGASDRFINDLAFQVPEPASMTLLAAGLGLVGLRRRRG